MARLVVDDGDDETTMLPPGPIAFTPNDGVHVYVQSTGLRNRTRFAPGLDYRGAGGYVIAPPSVVVVSARRRP